MSSSFGINDGTIPRGGTWLESGQEAWIINGKAIEGSVSDAHYSLGRKEVQETFKLIASTTEINAKLLRMPDLGEPMPVSRNAKKPTNTRSLMFGDDDSASADDWITDEYGVIIQRLD